jgi:hypothetical protein
MPVYWRRQVRQASLVRESTVSRPTSDHDPELLSHYQKGSDEMRMFIFLVVAALAMSFSLYSSAGGLKRASISAPQATGLDANPTPRCANSKRVRQAANVGCVMKGKRRSA